jgi:hypothetical protein
MPDKTAIVDPYMTCRVCGYRIRPGWRTDEHAEICGRCADEEGETADHIAVNEEDYTRRDPWRGSEYD